MMREQFEYSLINPLLFWSLKTKDEVSVLIGETAAVMVAFDQRNPHHCYDLFLHTMHTVAGIKETAPALLRVAAFFHDIGKPIVAMEKQGRLVFYGHAQKSAKVACPILKEMGYSDADIKEICFYIKHHDDLCIRYHGGKDGSPQECTGTAEESNQNFKVQANYF